VAGFVCAPLSCAPPQVAESGLGPGGWTDAIVSAGGEVWDPTAATNSGDLQEQPCEPDEAGLDGDWELYVTPIGLDFGMASQSRSLLVRNLGSGSLEYRVSSDVGWVTLEGSQGVSSGEYKRVPVYVDRGGLAPGTYEGCLTVAASDQQISVTLQMTVAEGEDWQAEPILYVDQLELDFGWGGSQTSFLVQNIGTGEMGYTVSSDVEWAVPSQVDGVSSGEEDLIHVDVTREGLAPGDYIGLITVETPEGQWHGVTLQMEVLLSAASWGFDPADSTHAIRSAIASGASKFLIPNMGQPWVVRPIQLASDQEIYFEPGVVLLAKEGEFHDTRDCLITGQGVQNVLLWGYGATLRMRKADYVNPDLYEESEWRHCLWLNGCENVRVYGLTLESSGGDGICIGGWQEPCRDIEVLDCVCDDNYRQGISVGNAETLRITNCILRNTAGTNPQAGIDLEPDHDWDVLTDIIISDCVSQANARSGYVVWLAKLTADSREVSIRFENCQAIECGRIGYDVYVGENGATGLVEFDNCSAERTDYQGMAVSFFSSEAVNVRFADCTWTDVSATNPDRRPLVLEMPLVSELGPHGQVEFYNCALHDSRDRKFLLLLLTGGDGDVVNAVGNIDVFNPHGSAGWTPPDELIGLTVSFFD